MPHGAAGAETVINFDEGGLADGTEMMGRTLQGVTFGEGPLGPFFSLRPAKLLWLHALRAVLSFSLRALSTFPHDTL